MMSGENRTPGLRPRRLTEVGPDTAEPARSTVDALKQRACAVLSSVWTVIRPTRNRATGYVAIGAVAALIGTSVAVGVGASGAVPHLADIGAWLSSSERGEAAHANGLTGDVDGKVDLPGMEKNPVSISQDGKTVLVLDKKTGKVVRIDPAQLTAEQSSNYGASDLQLVSGGSFSYIVNPGKGTVQRIDPVTTTPIGAPVDLPPPLGDAVVDPSGTLWVPLPANGQVVPFPGGKRSAALDIAGKNHNLVMTLANGQPVVTDTAAAATSLLTTSGKEFTVKLGKDIDKASPETVLVPKSTDGDVVPVLATESGKLTLVNVQTGSPVHASLGASEHEYGAPQVLGSKVYVPDHSEGSLKVYDTDEAAIEDSIAVTKEPGELDVFVRNGLLWVNDQDNAAAAVINADGKVNRIGKYKTHVPTAKKPKKSSPVDDNVPNNPAPNPGPPRPGVEQPGPSAGDPGPRKPGPGPKPKPSTPNRPTPSQPGSTTPPPMAPGTPQAQSGPGVITINFSPSSGMKPKDYQLRGAPAGADVTPSQVGPDGPFTFQVRGGSCDQEYSFTVVAEFAGGESKESGPSGAARPCLAPGAPQGLNIAIPQGGHGANLTWQPPSNGGAGVTYTVTWPGGSQTTPNTSFNITGLRNGQQYSVSVASSNAAGGGAATSGTADLTPPAQTMNIAHNDNDSSDLNIRSSPNSGAGIVGKIPGNTSPAVTVRCKTTGSNERHPYTGASSNVWGSITYNGSAGGRAASGYVADIYLDSRTNGNVWDCT